MSVFLMPTVFGLLIVLLISIMLTSSLTLCWKYKYYSKIYKELPTYTFVVNDCTLDRESSQIYALGKSFVYFGNNGDFRLNPHSSLHNAFFTYTDPYSLYWLIKYRKWVKKNIDVNTLESYNPFKHIVL